MTAVQFQPAFGNFEHVDFNVVEKGTASLSVAKFMAGRYE